MSCKGCASEVKGFNRRTCDPFSRFGIRLVFDCQNCQSCNLLCHATFSC